MPQRHASLGNLEVLHQKANGSTNVFSHCEQENEITWPTFPQMAAEIHKKCLTTVLVFFNFLPPNWSKNNNTDILYAPKSWTCQFRQLRGVASESKWQHHCIYSLWAGECNKITNFSTDGCRNPQKMPNYSFGIFQFLAEFLKIIVWNQNRCCWLGSVYIFH